MMGFAAKPEPTSNPRVRCGLPLARARPVAPAAKLLSDRRRSLRSVTDSALRGVPGSAAEGRPTLGPEVRFLGIAGEDVADEGTPAFGSHLRARWRPGNALPPRRSAGSCAGDTRAHQTCGKRDYPRAAPPRCRRRILRWRLRAGRPLRWGRRRRLVGHVSLPVVRRSSLVSRSGARRCNRATTRTRRPSCRDPP